MRFTHLIAEEEMVAHFLHTELHSERFGAAIRSLLEQKELTPKLLEQPDLHNASENRQRADLLGD
jgi:hypothetical protein